MTLNVESIRRQLEVEAIQRQEVAEEEAAIPQVEDGIAELEDLAQEMEDRGEPDPEEITDPQAVADVLSNGEIYPQPITVQDVRTAVAEATDTWDAMQTTAATGTLTTSDGTTVYVDIDQSTTDAVEPSMKEKLDLLDEIMAEVKIEEEEEKKSVKVKWATPEERKFYYDQKWTTQKHILREKRLDRIRGIIIGPDDLIIHIGNSSEKFYHTDNIGNVPISEMVGLFEGRRLRHNSTHQSYSHQIVFDKHLNYLTVDQNNGVKVRRDSIRVRTQQLASSSNRHSGESISFVIISKSAFVQSKGRVWKVQRHQDVSLARRSEARKRLISKFIQVEQAITFMRNSLEVCHPAEDFDIFYNMNGTDPGFSHFALIFKFRDIVIHNSIEMSHPIGEMIVKSNGVQYINDRPDRDLNLAIESGLSGMRMSFTPTDAVMKYQHSHLPSGLRNFSGFCTGMEAYDIPSPMKALDLEQHVWKVKNFIQWESLEGGPHYKMENISLQGQKVSIKNNLITHGRMVSTPYAERVIRDINNLHGGFGIFSDCFQLVNQRNRLRFIADYPRFYEKMIELFPNDILRMVNRHYSEVLYTYNSSEQTFHKLRNESMTDPMKVLEKARAEMNDMNPVYMNGKYHRPHFSTRVVENISKGVKFCMEPNFMRELAQLILFHLTNKLEEHGNTSESNNHNGNKAEAG